MIALSRKKGGMNLSLRTHIRSFDDDPFYFFTLIVRESMRSGKPRRFRHGGCLHLEAPLPPQPPRAADPLPGRDQGRAASTQRRDPADHPGIGADGEDYPANASASDPTSRGRVSGTCAATGAGDDARASGGTTFDHPAATSMSRSRCAGVTPMDARNPPAFEAAVADVSVRPSRG
jgi:hypothetical protein